jgi:hypothetical protein
MPNGKRGGNTKPRRSSGFTVEGKSVEDLLKTGSAYLKRLTESHLRQVVTRLSSAANKRLRRAEKAGAGNSPAIEKVKNSGGKFSGKGKDRAGLEQEFIRLRDFFRDPTSTMEGWKRVQEQAERKAKREGILKAQDHKPKAWEYDPDTGTYSHPDYGEGFSLDEAGDTFFNDEGEQLPNTRMYHDYSATDDWRKTENGTETGDIWAMVDSIAKLDPRFSSFVGSYETRLRLFDEIDNAFVRNEEWTLEEARDHVMSHLDDIYNDYTEHLNESMGLGASTFFRDV